MMDEKIVGFNHESPIGLSVSGHFRICADVYESLEDEARTRKVSLNTLVNQILSTYTRDESLYERLGILKLPKDTYRLMLQLMPDDKLTEFAKELIRHWPTTLMLARSGAINVHAVLNELRDASKLGFLSLYVADRNGMKVISMSHEFGPKHSVILSAAAMGLFGMVGIHPSVTTTDSSVTIEY